MLQCWSHSGYPWKPLECLSNVKQCVGGGLSYQQCVSRLMSWDQDPPYSCHQTAIYSEFEQPILIDFSFLNTSHLLPCLSVLFLMFFRGRYALESASLRIKSINITAGLRLWGDLLHLNGQIAHAKARHTRIPCRYKQLCVLVCR